MGYRAISARRPCPNPSRFATHRHVRGASSGLPPSSKFGVRVRRHLATPQDEVPDRALVIFALSPAEGVRQVQEAVPPLEE